MKKVLVITYYWPPAGGPGVQRVLKFVKYLPDFSWRPVILTVENGDYPAIDYSLGSEIPSDVAVYKIPIWEPYNLYRKLLGKRKSQAIPVAVLSQKQNLSVKAKLLHWLRANVFIPDARIGWYFAAVREASRIIEKEKIDCVLVSSPPHSLQLIGLKLKSKFNLPLISDLRDPWTDIHYYSDVNRLGISQRIDTWLEKKTLTRADLVTTVSPAMHRLFKAKAEKVNCRVVYNGYDQSDFNATVERSSEAFILAYVGNFKANQNSDTLWATLAELLKENREFAGHFRLEFTGKLSDDTLHSLRDYGLWDKVIFNDYLPHNEAVIKMKQASALLFIIPMAESNQGILTGKLFDYLAAGTPLLSIGPSSGDAAQLLSETSAGPMLSYEDKSAIKQRILSLFEAWQEKKLEQFCPNKQAVTKYERSKITHDLANLLDATAF
ncbi:MAG TPA: glycosyl transferase family 1 [Calditrichaeota bacterium]|nr:glycosyl transferase family 1 [Calditrichota bacterium]